MKKKTFLSIILARGGSKGLKKKNIKKLNGKHLIYYTIQASLLSQYIDRTIVSTDDQAIKKISLNYGAEVPFLRPKKYSLDGSTSEDSISHCLKWLKINENYNPDYVVYLQCTEPFRSIYLIDNGIKKIISQNLDSVFAVSNFHKNIWIQKNKKISRAFSFSNNYLPRQFKMPLFLENTGSFLVSKAGVFNEKKRIGNKIGIIFDKDYVPLVDIHNEYDLKLAQIIMKNLKLLGKDIKKNIIL